MALSGIYPVTLSKANFEETYTAIDGSDPSFPGFQLGDVCIDNLGGQWMFCKAGELITQYSLCVVTQASVEAGTYLLNMVEIGDINTGPKILGINQVAIASGSYGWIHRGPGGGYGKGCKVRSVGFTKGALAHPDASNAGAVDDDNVDEGVIAGLTTLATTTTEEAVEYIATTVMTCNLTEAD